MSRYAIAMLYVVAFAVAGYLIVGRTNPQRLRADLERYLPASRKIFSEYIGNPSVPEPVIRRSEPVFVDLVPQKPVRADSAEPDAAIKEEQAMVAAMRLVGVISKNTAIIEYQGQSISVSTGGLVCGRFTVTKVEAGTVSLSGSGGAYELRL